MNRFFIKSTVHCLYGGFFAGAPGYRRGADGSSQRKGRQTGLFEPIGVT